MRAWSLFHFLWLLWHHIMYARIVNIIISSSSSNPAYVAKSGHRLSISFSRWVFRWRCCCLRVQSFVYCNLDKWYFVVYFCIMFIWKQRSVRAQTHMPPQSLAHFPSFHGKISFENIFTGEISKFLLLTITIIVKWMNARLELRLTILE